MWCGNCPECFHFPSFMDQPCMKQDLFPCHCLPAQPQVLILFVPPAGQRRRPEVQLKHLISVCQTGRRAADRFTEPEPYYSKREVSLCFIFNQLKNLQKLQPVNLWMFSSAQEDPCLFSGLIPVSSDLKWFLLSSKLFFSFFFFFDEMSVICARPRGVIKLSFCAEAVMNKITAADLRNTPDRRNFIHLYQMLTRPDLPRWLLPPKLRLILLV